MDETNPVVVEAPSAVPEAPAAPVKRGPGRPRRFPVPVTPAKPEGVELGPPKVEPKKDAPKPEPKPELKSIAPRPRAGTRVTPGTAADPYDQLARNVEDQKAIIAQIRREHPNSPLGDASDPRQTKRELGEPLLPAELFGDLLRGAHEGTVEHLELEVPKPAPRTWDSLGKAWERASRYWLSSNSPAILAFAGAALPTVAVFGPLGLAAMKKARS
jgi:hypothetical protein